MGFSRQEYWSGLPCPPPGDLPNPGSEALHWQVGSLPRAPLSPWTSRKVGASPSLKRGGCTQGHRKHLIGDSLRSQGPLRNSEKVPSQDGEAGRQPGHSTLPDNTAQTSRSQNLLESCQPRIREEQSATPPYSNGLEHPLLRAPWCPGSLCC